MDICSTPHLPIKKTTPLAPDSCASCVNLAGLSMRVGNPAYIFFFQPLNFRQLIIGGEL